MISLNQLQNSGNTCIFIRHGEKNLNGYDLSSEGKKQSLEFAEKLLRSEKVALVPGNAFGESGNGFIRCSYATSISKIDEALARIERFLQQNC